MLLLAQAKRPAYCLGKKEDKDYVLVALVAGHRLCTTSTNHAIYCQKQTWCIKRHSWHEIWHNLTRIFDLAYMFGACQTMSNIFRVKFCHIFRILLCIIWHIYDKSIWHCLTSMFGIFWHSIVHNMSPCTLCQTCGIVWLLIWHGMAWFLLSNFVKLWLFMSNSMPNNMPSAAKCMHNHT